MRLPAVLVTIFRYSRTVYSSLRAFYLIFEYLHVSIESLENGVSGCGVLLLLFPLFLLIEEYCCCGSSLRMCINIMTLRAGCSVLVSGVEELKSVAGLLGSCENVFVENVRKCHCILIKVQSSSKGIRKCGL